MEKWCRMRTNRQDVEDGFEEQRTEHEEERGRGKWCGKGGERRSMIDGVYVGLERQLESKQRVWRAQSKVRTRTMSATAREIRLARRC